MPPECFAPFIVPFRGEASDTDESRNTSNTSTTDDSRNTSVNAQITQANPFFVPDEYVAALDLKVKAVAGLRKRYVLHFPNPSDCLPKTVCPYIAMYKTDTFVVQSQSGDGTTGHREPCGGQRFPKTGNSQSADACHRGGVFGVGLHGNSSGGGG